MQATPDGGGGGNSQYTHGMDFVKVEDIISRLVKAKNELVEAQTKANGAVKKLGPDNWGGNDAADFRSQWQKHATQLETSINSVQAMIKSARKDVEQQRQAST